MGAGIALGNIFEKGVIDVIDSFVDDSSLLTTCGTTASGIADMKDIGGYQDLNQQRIFRQREYNMHMQRFLYEESLEYPLA